MGVFSSGKCKSKARLDGKTAIVTGGNNGIGYETSLELLKRGCKVIIACRSLQRGNTAAGKLKAAVPGGQLRIVILDLSSLKSVKKCATEILDTEAEIHLLINNAGMVGGNRIMTEDNYESTFQVNHLGHYLFTRLLLDRIKSSAPARIISVSSLLHYNAKLNFNDLQSTNSYDAMRVYGESKLCNILFILELQKQLKDSGVTAYSLHPGAVDTDITHDVPGCMGSIIQRSPRCFIKTPEQGAQTTLHCAIDEDLSEQKALYYSDCKKARTSRRARNMDDADKLWKISEDLVKQYL